MSINWPLFLNDVNINCSRLKLDEKYVTHKIQINDANELVELFFTATFALSFRSKLFIWILFPSLENGYS